MKKTLTVIAIAMSVVFGLVTCSTIAATLPGPGDTVRHATTSGPAGATRAQQNALRAANQYLEVMAFSRAGLIEQLSSEYGDGYTRDDAVWAVDRCGADWDDQAVRAAERYLEVMAFSRAGLIEQLSSEHGDGFTVAQATHAVDAVGL
jgi:hypothetical protein